MSVSYKLFERLLLRRLEPVFDPQLPDKQAGFRHDQCITDQVFKLTYDVEHRLEKTVNQALYWQILLPNTPPPRLIYVTSITINNQKSMSFNQKSMCSSLLRLVFNKNVFSHIFSVVFLVTCILCKAVVFNQGSASTVQGYLKKLHKFYFIK